MERQAETFSTRAASARQSSRADQVVRDALAGDQEGAVRVLSGALTQPGARGPLIEGVATGVAKVADYWSVLPVVQLIEDDPSADTEVRSIAGALRERLGERLDQLLRLSDDMDGELFIPVMTPIVLEIGDGLVPLVDQRQDDGHFLFELVPAMKDRVRDSSGVSIPGVRARGNPNLGGIELAVEIDEVRVTQASMHVDGVYTVRPADTAAVDGDVATSEFHPLTGDGGLWRIEHVSNEVAADSRAATLSPAQYLAHRLERVIRAHLPRMIGAQEVDAMLARWRADDPETVALVCPDRRAVERTTVLLQELAAERVPFTDWRAVLDAVVDAGGIDTDVRELRRAIRMRVRDALPGPRSGPQLLHVPSAIQASLARYAGTGLDPDHARVDFLSWLHRSVQTYGTVLSLVTDDAPTREIVAALAATERAVVLTFTTEELGSE
jgi:hypothetical protein